MEPEQPALAGKKITIIGAGIAGLSFVISLKKKWSPALPFPHIVIYERNSKEASISHEGYSISIRGDAYGGGTQVLQDIGIPAPDLAVSVSGGTSDSSGNFGIWDAKWNRILDLQGEPGLRIARDVLRQELVDRALDGEGVEIRWATPCDSAKVEDGKVTVLLPDGEVDHSDILIAADGANSKMRNTFRPDDKLSFAGAISISGTSRFPAEQVPPPVDLNWGTVVGGGGTGLFVSPIDSSSALWSVSYLSDEPREKPQRPYSNELVDNLLHEALDRGKAFAEPFRSMVQNTDPDSLMLINAMDKQPFAHPDPQIPVFFIGDSNHAVSPFAGNGANMALRDGWDLADQLSMSQSLPHAVTAYDKASVPRCQSTVSHSHWAISIAHATGLKLFVYRVCLKLVAMLVRLKR